jgi:hypothetical protein
VQFHASHCAWTGSLTFKKLSVVQRKQKVETAVGQCRSDDGAQGSGSEGLSQVCCSMRVTPYSVGDTLQGLEGAWMPARKATPV